MRCMGGTRMSRLAHNWGVFQLYEGDCLDALQGMADNSVDSIVTDPPYGLSFMCKKWDYDVPSTEIWAECLRVLKPGGYLLAFAGTRTQHRMCCRIEDAGFEIRDMIAWVYGSGFPKSHNGGWGGTALKPALEPITMARKPLVGTVEANWTEYGTGALNIDWCRVGGESTLREKAAGRGQFPHEEDAWSPKAVTVGRCAGRWPANLIHDGSDDVLEAFPTAPGQMADVSHTAPSPRTSNVYGAMSRGDEFSADSDNNGTVGFKMKPGARRLDAGSAARFFYCAKTSKSDRNEGLERMATKAVGSQVQRSDGHADLNDALPVARENYHPTVKPTDLMRYLCRLVTPPGGIVLDPFMGSGSTGKAAMLEGFTFIGCERDAGYMTIAQRRIAHAKFGDLA